MMEGWEKKGHLYSSKSQGPEMSVCREETQLMSKSKGMCPSPFIFREM